MAHTVYFSFEYDTERRASLIERSVGREIGAIDDERSRTGLRRNGRTVEIEIEARDLVALRAATNTWCSLVGVAERVAETGPF